MPDQSRVPIFTQVEPGTGCAVAERPAPDGHRVPAPGPDPTVCEPAVAFSALFVEDGSLRATGRTGYTAGDAR